MSLESGNFIDDLIATNPPGSDPVSQGDDHIRLIKHVLKDSFPTINAPLTASLVPFVPTGTIAATNVQDAIVELATDTGDVINAIDVVFAPWQTISATNVQAAIQEISKASEISFIPAGTIGSNNVQNAIQELDGDLSGKVAKAGDTMTGILNMTGGGVSFQTKDSTQSHSSEYYAPSSAKSSLYAQRVSSVTYLTLNVANNAANYDHAHNGIAYAPVSWNDQSDISLKSNLAQITGALDKLSLIHGYIYDRNDYPGSYAGVVAQEIQSVLPQAISDHNGTLSVSPMAVVALLVQAVKELKVQVDALSNP